eukprot:4121020-Pyramimonas_sp.AAC.1
MGALWSVVDVRCNLVGGLSGASCKQFRGLVEAVMSPLDGLLGASWWPHGATCAPLGASWWGSL